MVPLETTAFRFAEKVEQALGRAVQLATFRAPNMPISDSSVQARSAEQWLETQDKQVGGQVDLISITPDGVTLKDYKSGTIHEGDEGTIKEAYSMQLKLYAAIYHDAYGEWPKTLELAPLFGQPQQVPFTEKECLELLEQAKAELARVNSLVERKAIQDAANPSPKCCRYCGFRPVCSKYLKAIQIPSANSWPSDVVGRIDSIVAAGTRRVISVNMAGKPVKIWMPESDGTVSGSLKVGDALNAFNLAKRSSGDLEIWKGTFVSD
jgi:CRISPR/Cas system-associated exonuclease Cas4 (RecB family)